MVFYNVDSLPQAYRGGAFVGEHGSWDRDKFNGYRVVFVSFKDGRPNGKAQDVVTGFLNDQGEAHGRPVGVAIDKTGALLIADDAGGTVWRVTPRSSDNGGVVTSNALRFTVRLRCAQRLLQLPDRISKAYKEIKEMPSSARAPAAFRIRTCYAEQSIPGRQILRAAIKAMAL